MGQQDHNKAGHREAERHDAVDKRCGVLEARKVREQRDAQRVEAGDVAGGEELLTLPVLGELVVEEERVRATEDAREGSEDAQAGQRGKASECRSTQHLVAAGHHEGRGAEHHGEAEPEEGVGGTGRLEMGTSDVHGLCDRPDTDSGSGGQQRDECRWRTSAANARDRGHLGRRHRCTAVAEVVRAGVLR